MRLATMGARLVALLVVFSTGSAWAEDEKPQHSGFLGDDSVYAQLEEVELHKKVKGQRWIGPSLNISNYQSVLVDDVVLYPEPEPGPQVSAETLDQIRDYLTTELKKKIGATLTLADAAGPGVLEIRGAVTGVAVKTEGMKAYEVIPVSAIFHGIQAAAGKRDRDVHVFLEARLVDSQSGELVGAVLRRVAGEDLKGKKDQLTLKDMQDSLDQVSDDAAGALSTALK